MTPPTLSRRLVIAVLGVNTAALIGIIVTMSITEYLRPAVRVPVLTVLLVLVSVVWTSVLRRRVRALIERPLAEQVAIAEAIASGDTTQRLATGTSRELDQLANSVNRMTDQLLVANQLRTRAEKLATLGRIAAGVSHEIGNPLSAIANYAHVVRMRTEHVEGATAPLEAMEREIARIDRIMRGLLDYARPKRLTPRPTIVDEVIGDALQLLADQGATRRYALHVSLGAPSAQVYAERHDLVQMFVNLLLNALDAIRANPASSGELAIRSCTIARADFAEASERRRTDIGAGRWKHAPSPRAIAWLAKADAPERFLQIVIADSGSGVAAGDEDRIFEPFFSTKEPGKGTGLGLAIVASTVDGLGGTVWVQRAREGGAAFVILLPLHASNRSDDAVPPGEAPSRVSDAYD